MEPSTAAPSPKPELQLDDSHVPSVARRTITALLMVLTVAIGAYLLSEKTGVRDAANLVGLVGSVPIDPEPLLKSARASEIQEVLFSVLGYRLVVPTVAGSEILGLGTWDAGRNVKIPVVSYDDPQGDIRTTLILNYAMLDKISSAVFLDRSIRMELEQDRSYAVVSASDNREVVVWRSGDDIFVAIAENGASRLIPRISLSGSSTQR